MSEVGKEGDECGLLASTALTMPWLNMGWSGGKAQEGLIIIIGTIHGAARLILPT